VFCCDVGGEETENVKGLKDTMLSFCSIERDMKQAEETVKYVMTQVQCLMTWGAKNPDSWSFFKSPTQWVLFGFFG